MGRTVGSFPDTKIPLQTALDDYQESTTPKVAYLRRTTFHIPNEDERHMMCFLRHMEMMFFDAGLRQEHWGQELRRYWTGDALRYCF